MPIYNMPVDHAAEFRLLGTQSDRIECGAVIVADEPSLAAKTADIIAKYRDGLYTSDDLRTFLMLYIGQTTSYEELQAVVLAMYESLV